MTARMLATCWAGAFFAFVFVCGAIVDFTTNREDKS